MEGKINRVLFVNSEMVPYLPESECACASMALARGIQDKKVEIRSFMPRYGLINERKNQLHEVIRLSGMNIVIDDVDRPLIIKVASLPAARMQVYFIDNDDFFRRKQICFDADGKFFEDNAQRAIFFARGMLETVKKLRWAPDVIHCQGWITNLIPLYLKKAYSSDPIFAESKVVTSLYNEIPDEKFGPSLKDSILFGNIKPEDVDLSENADGTELAKLAARYSDGIIFGDSDLKPEIADFCKGLNIPTLAFNQESRDNGNYVKEYDEFYQQL